MICTVTPQFVENNKWVTFFKEVMDQENNENIYNSKEEIWEGKI